MLESKEDYNKILINSKQIKAPNRIFDRENLKDFSRMSKQNQVMNIARVNSIFPNDILALMPSSFFSKPEMTAEN